MMQVKRTLHIGNSARVRRIDDVDVMLRDHCLDGTAEKRCKVPGQRRNNKDCRTWPSGRPRFGVEPRYRRLANHHFLRYWDSNTVDIHRVDTEFRFGCFRWVSSSITRQLAEQRH